VRICILALVARLIERLVGLLGGAGTTQRQALASLARFGGRAVTALTLQFMRTRSVAMQRGIVAALTRKAPGLKQEERLDLLTEVMGMVRFAADATVCRDRAAVQTGDVRPPRRLHRRLSSSSCTLEARS
jgi:hypothetical protein